MSLGLFKRVALWRTNRQLVKLHKRLTLVSLMDPSDPLLPIEMANVWRAIDVSLITRIPLDIQVSTPLTRRHDNLAQVVTILDRVFSLISDDDYIHFNRYLSDILGLNKVSTLSEYLTDDTGYAVNVKDVFVRINAQLYSMASIMDALETYEYHRGISLLFKDLISVIEQILNTP